MEIDLNNYAVQCVHRAGFWKENALFVWQRSCTGRCNAASEVTEASLASLHSFSCAKGGLQRFLFQQVRCEHVVLWYVLTIVHHSISKATRGFDKHYSCYWWSVVGIFIEEKLRSRSSVPLHPPCGHLFAHGQIMYVSIVRCLSWDQMLLLVIWVKCSATLESYTKIRYALLVLLMKRRELTTRRCASPAIRWRGSRPPEWVVRV